MSVYCCLLLADIKVLRLRYIHGYLLFSINTSADITEFYNQKLIMCFSHGLFGKPLQQPLFLWTSLVK